jgi:hypothetical protein
VAARSDACASRSRPRRTIFLAVLAWLNRSRQVAADGPSRASLRTRGVAAWPAWKAASVRDLAARRREGVQGEAPGSVLFRWAARTIWRTRAGLESRLTSRTIKCPLHRNGAIGKAGANHHRRDPTPAAGRIGLAIWPPSNLASKPDSASEGTRAGGVQAHLAMAGLANRGQREKWCALVLLDTRKHRSALPRAFRWEPIPSPPGTPRKRRSLSPT